MKCHSDLEIVTQKYCSLLIISLFQAPCESTTVGCTSGVCTCSTGFGRPDCCQCDNFYYDPLPNAGSVDCQRRLLTNQDS